ncbi:MAG: chemotaxis protein CheA [Kofleriaceae bacterium]|nr:chemotaxis protein CheA [Kofleriaceae bacterium]
MQLTQDDVVRAFAVEAKELLDVLEHELLRLEQNPRDAEVVATLFRAAHTLKGNASIVELAAVEAFTHTIEDVFERVRDGVVVAAPELVTLLLRAVDALRRIIPRALAGEADPAPEHEALRRWLDLGGSGNSATPDVAGPVAGAQDRGLDHGGTLRVAIGRLDRMVDLLGEITIARSRVTNLLATQSSHRFVELRDAHDEAERLYLELQGEIMRARMVPLGPTLQRYERLVRDLALTTGKDVRLAIEGEDVEVDLAVVDGIKDPLTHMIRNAVDHGIEPEDVRRARGKPAVGTVSIRAARDGGGIVITVSDDGGGLDRERILARARATKLVEPGVTPPDASLFKLIFAPSFSTAATVSEVSGRGVGMNIVQTNVEALHGTVSVASVAGQGTTITVRLPLTLAIIDGFTVRVGREMYVLPLDAVVECIELPEVDRRSDRAQGLLDVDGTPLPYVRLATLLGVERSPDARESVVILRHGDEYAGIVVDELEGTRETVVKPLTRLVDDDATFTGCTLLGTGRVALILDVPALLDAAARGEHRVVLT